MFWQKIAVGKRTPYFPKIDRKLNFQGKILSMEKIFQFLKTGGQTIRSVSRTKPPGKRFDQRNSQKGVSIDESIDFDSEIRYGALFGGTKPEIRLGKELSRFSGGGKGHPQLRYA